MPILIDSWHAACRSGELREKNAWGSTLTLAFLPWVKSADPELEQVLRLEEAIGHERDVVSWRYGVLYGMLWPRGEQQYEVSRYARGILSVNLPECDRLLVLAAVPRSTRRVDLSNPGWFQELATL